MNFKVVDTISSGAFCNGVEYFSKFKLSKAFAPFSSAEIFTRARAASLDITSAGSLRRLKMLKRAVSDSMRAVRPFSLPVRPGIISVLIKTRKNQLY